MKALELYRAVLRMTRKMPTASLRRKTVYNARELAELYQSMPPESPLARSILERGQRAVNTMGSILTSDPKLVQAIFRDFESGRLLRQQSRGEPHAGARAVESDTESTEKLVQ